MTRRRRKPVARREPSEGRCGSCGQRVWWLLNNRTNQRAPIDEYPEPGGNISVSFRAGTYRVIPREELPQHDPTIADPDAHPTLYVHHAVNCPTVLRRQAQQPQATPLPLPLELPAEATAATTSRRPGSRAPRCQLCDIRFTWQEIAAGLTRHPHCEPERTT